MSERFRTATAASAFLAQVAFICTAAAFSSNLFASEPIPSGASYDVGFSPYGGSTPKPDFFPSPQIQPSDDSVEIDGLYAAEGVVAAEEHVAPRHG